MAISCYCSLAYSLWKGTISTLTLSSLRYSLKWYPTLSLFASKSDPVSGPWCLSIGNLYGKFWNKNSSLSLIKTGYFWSCCSLRAFILALCIHIGKWVKYFTNQSIRSLFSLGIVEMFRVILSNNNIESTTWLCDGKALKN